MKGIDINTIPDVNQGLSGVDPNKIKNVNQGLEGEDANLIPNVNQGMQSLVVEHPKVPTLKDIREYLDVKSVGVGLNLPVLADFYGVDDALMESYKEDPAEFWDKKSKATLELMDSSPFWNSMVSSLGFGTNEENRVNADKKGLMPHDGITEAMGDLTGMVIRDSVVAYVTKLPFNIVMGLDSGVTTFNKRMGHGATVSNAMKYGMITGTASGLGATAGMAIGKPAFAEASSALMRNMLVTKVGNRVATTGVGSIPHRALGTFVNAYEAGLTKMWDKTFFRVGSEFATWGAVDEFAKKKGLDAVSYLSVDDPDKYSQTELETQQDYIERQIAGEHIPEGLNGYAIAGMFIGGGILGVAGKQLGKAFGKVVKKTSSKVAEKRYKVTLKSSEIQDVAILEDAVYNMDGNEVKGFVDSVEVFMNKFNVSKEKAISELWNNSLDDAFKTIESKRAIYRSMGLE